MLKNFDEKLYQMLPSIYRREDSKIRPIKEPLKRFIQLMSEGGFEPTIDSIKSLHNINNLDIMEPQYLPLVANLLGLDFPYDMDENSQRKFLKIVPTLYKLKGSEDAFNYLAREIFSTKSTISTVIPKYEEGMSVEEWKKIFITIEVDGGLPQIQRKEDNYRKFAELIRPVNWYLLIMLRYIYYVEYDFQGRVLDTSFVTLKDCMGTEDYRYNLFIDGVLQSDTKNGALLGDKTQRALHLNIGKLYNKQEIELVDKIIEQHVSDNIYLNESGIEEFNFKRVSDLIQMFNLNKTLLNSERSGLSYFDGLDVINILDSFKYNKKMDDVKESSSLIVPYNVDVYRKRKVKVNGVDNHESNSEIILGESDETSFNLNEAKTYRDQLIEYEPTLYDEDGGTTLKALVETEKSHIRGDDYLGGIITNRTHLNNKSKGLNNIRLETKVIPQVDYDTFRVDIKEEYLDNHFILNEDNFNVNKTGDGKVSSKLTITKANLTKLNGTRKLTTGFTTTEFVPTQLSFTY